MRTLAFVSGLVPAALQAGIAVILVGRKLHRRFPYFFAYTLYSILATAVHLLVIDHQVAFFVVYWTTQVLYGTLALLAILEVFTPTLESYLGLRGARIVPPLAFLGMIGVALWRAFYHPVGRGGFLSQFAAGAYAFTLCVLCVEALVLLVCLRLAFRRPYPVRWGRYRLGILAGFGLQACASALAFLGRFNFGARFDTVFHYVLPGAYIGAAATWLIAFAGKEQPRSRKRPDIDAIRRAIDYIQHESDGAKRDLGTKLSGLPEPHPVYPSSADASPAKQ